MSRNASSLASVAAHLIAVVAVGFALYPVLWVVSTALSGGEAPEPTAIPWPKERSWEHFIAVAFHVDDSGRWLFGRQLFNSVVIASVTALLSVIIATPAAYAMSRFDFAGKRFATGTMLATQMFPGVAAIIPLYLLLDAVGLINTRTGLILVYATTAVPFALFQLRGTFDSVPADLDDAAMVDGATRFVAFVRVVLPAARPGIAISTLFAFMTAWNEFILAATFLSHEDLYTLPIVLWTYAGEHSTNWGHFCAGAILVSLPVIALFYILQRYLVGGLTTGGVKG